jgi:hypothetical protein
MRWVKLSMPAVAYAALHLTCTPARVMPSTWRQGMYDQPFNAADLLLGFKNMNEQQLSQVNPCGPVASRLAFHDAHWEMNGAWQRALAS